MKKFLVAVIVGVPRAFQLPRPTQDAPTNSIRGKLSMKNPGNLIASVLAALTIVIIAGSAQAITYQVNQSWADGAATLVGTVDVPLGTYTIMDGGAAPFTNVMLTVTVNGTSFTLDHADTSMIYGTGEFIIEATMTSLTFDTASADVENPADLNFYDSSNANRYVLGSNGAPHFEAAFTTAGDLADNNISFPFLFGSAEGGGITLTAYVFRQGGKRYVGLTWSPANGGGMNVLRNGSVIKTTADDGHTKTHLGNHTGIFAYQVCETDTGTCSNEVTIRVH
jgi:hypothetical protein